MKTFFIFFSVIWIIAASAEETHSSFWTDKLRISPINREKFRNEFERVKFPERDKDLFCAAAFELPPALRSLPAAPDYHGFVGSSGDQFLIPITGDSRNVMEPGDIVITHKPFDNDPYSLVNGKNNHAALVIKEGDELKFLESPPRYTKRIYDAYTIIRLRKYPKEVTSEKILKDWQADPDKKAKLDAWTKQREEILAKVTRFAATLNAGRFGYNSNYATPFVADPTARAHLTEKLAAGDCPANLKFYCSELPVSLYHLAGVNLPKGSSPAKILEKIDERVVLPRMRKLRETREQAVDATLNEVFRDRHIIDLVGADQAEKYRATLRTVLLTEGFTRSAALVALSAISKNEPVSPDDLVRSVMDANGDFSYVGTYLGAHCDSVRRANEGSVSTVTEPPPPPIAAPAGKDETFRDRRSNAHFVYAFREHAYPVSGIVKDAKHSAFVSSGDDQTLRAFDYEKFEGRTLVSGTAQMRPRLTPDGKHAVIANRDGKLLNVSLADNSQKSFDFDGQPIQTLISPDGKVGALQTDSKLIVFRVGTMEKIATLEKTQGVSSAAFSSDGKSLWYGTYANGLHRFSIDDKKDEIVRAPLADTDRLAARTRVNELRAMGDKILSASNNGEADVFDAAAKRVKGWKHRRGILASTTQGNSAWTISADGSLQKLKGDEVKVLSSGLKNMDRVKVSPDGKRLLVTSSTQNRFALLDADTGEKILEQPLTGTSNDVSFSPTGRWLWVADGREVKVLSEKKLDRTELGDALKQFGNAPSDNAERNAAEKFDLKVLMSGLRQETSVSRAQIKAMVEATVSGAAKKAEALEIAEKVFGRTALP